MEVIRVEAGQKSEAVKSFAFWATAVGGTRLEVRHTIRSLAGKGYIKTRTSVDSDGINRCRIILIKKRPTRWTQNK